jgi:hypothetical protein
VDARQEIDLRSGAAFTRFQTLLLRDRFEGLPASVISYGPCQFPTLGFITDRWLEVEAFTPEPFWVTSSIPLATAPCPWCAPPPATRCPPAYDYSHAELVSGCR